MILSLSLGLSLAVVAQQRPRAADAGRQNLAERLNRFGRVAERHDAATANDAPVSNPVRHADYTGDDGTRVVPTAEAEPPQPRTAGRSSRRTARPLPQQQRPLATPARPVEPNFIPAESDQPAPSLPNSNQPTPAKREPTLAKPRAKQAANEPTLAPPRDSLADPELADPAGSDKATLPASEPELTPAGEPTPAAKQPSGATPRTLKSSTLQDRLSRARKATPAKTDSATEPAVAPSDRMEPAPEATEPAPEQPVPAAEPEQRPSARTARIERPHLPNPDGSQGVVPLQRRGGDEMHVAHQSPLLGVETSGPRKIKVNEPATYRVVARNAGHGEAQDVIVTIHLPDWAEVVGSQAQTGTVQMPSAESTEGVQWRLEVLPGDSQAEMTMDIVPRKSRPFDLAVQWTHSPVSSNAMVEVQEAKLLMALSGPDEVFFGEQEVYKLTLSNPGTGDAENVVVRLLPSVPGESATASHEIGVIPAGHTKVVELELTARDPGRLMINAEAEASGGLHAQVTEEILVRRAELEVKLAGPRSQYAGTVATYAILVSNPGNAVAKNVEVAFMLPSGAAYVADNASGHLEGKGTKVVWRLPSLRPESQQRLEVKCKLDVPGTNQPQVVCVADGDLRDTGTLATHVEALADLRLEVYDPQGPVAVGGDVEYEMRVKNRGAKAAENVEVVAFFSEGVEPVSAVGEGHELGVGQVAFAPLVSIAGGQEVTLKLVARGQTAGNHMIRVQLRCQQLNTLLTQEETTHFYQADQELFEDSPDASPGDGYDAGADQDWQPDPEGQTLPEEEE